MPWLKNEHAVKYSSKPVGQTLGLLMYVAERQIKTWPNPDEIRRHLMYSRVMRVSIAQRFLSMSIPERTKYIEFLEANAETKDWCREIVVNAIAHGLMK